MEKVSAFIMENWAEIVAFFDKLFAILAEKIG